MIERCIMNRPHTTQETGLLAGLREFQARRAVTNNPLTAKSRTVLPGGKVIPLRTSRPTYTEGEFDSACEAVLALGEDATRWVCWRAIEYWSGPGKLWALRDQDYAAAIDYLRWHNQPKEP